MLEGFDVTSAERRMLEFIAAGPNGVRLRDDCVRWSRDRQLGQRVLAHLEAKRTVDGRDKSVRINEVGLWLLGR